MKHQLRKEIENLIQLLNAKKEKMSDQQLHESLRDLYELSVISHLKPKGEESASRSLETQQEKLFQSLESMNIAKEELTQEESSQDQEEIPELMDTIKNMVTEMPETQEVNELFTQIEEPHFVRKDETTSTAFEENPKREEIKSPPNLNEQFSKGLKVDLNDRLAFIQHLFNNQSTEYQRAMNQLTTFDSLAEAANFIDTMLKPDYNQWEGKDEYEERFLGILIQYFETK